MKTVIIETEKNQVTVKINGKVAERRTFNSTMDLCDWVNNYLKTEV